MEQSFFMSCDIKLSDDKKYVILKFQGKINKHIILPFIVQSHILAKKHKIDRFLVDMILAENRDTFPEKFDYAYSDVKKVSEINPAAVISVVVAPDDHSHDFIEKVLRKNNYDVTMFRSEREAVNYLYETAENREKIKKSLSHAAGDLPADC